jgi:hypothetical protein
MYAQTTTKRVPMFDPAVAAKVAEHVSGFYCQALAADGTPIPFDGMALIEEKCGRYTRGAHKGQLRGWAEITIVERGGWKKDAPGYLNGHVERPGQIRSIRITDFTGRCYLEVR